MISKEDMRLARKYIIRVVEVNNDMGGWYIRGVGKFNVYVDIQLSGDNFSIREEGDWVIISLELSTLNIKLTDLIYHANSRECRYDPNRDTWLDSVKEKYKDSIPVLRFNKFTREHHYYKYDSSRTYTKSSSKMAENIDDIDKICNRFVHSTFYDYLRGAIQSTVEVIPAIHK